MPSVSISKATAGIIGGTAGTGGLGTTAFALSRLATGHPIPPGLWVVSAALVAASALITSFSLVLDYRLKKLLVQAEGTQAATAAELQKERLAIHRTVLEKAAGEPTSAANYRELIIADALHLSVEQNGSQLADRTHAHLYGQYPA